MKGLRSRHVACTTLKYMIQNLYALSAPHPKTLANLALSLHTKACWYYSLMWRLHLNNLVLVVCSYPHSFM